MSHPVILKRYDDSVCFEDVIPPAVLTSGKLGAYYSQTHKMARIGDRFTLAGDSAIQMHRCAVEQLDADPGFREVIEIIAGEVKELFPSDIPNDRRMISGGQRKDWLFSGPVVHVLGYDHISLYKGDRVEKIGMAGEVTALDTKGHPLQGVQVVYVLDLISVGSSVYDPRSSPPTGWVPRLRAMGGEISDAVSVVSWKVGGEETLAQGGIRVKSFVDLDDDYLAAHSSQPAVAIAFHRDMDGWAETYLRKVGIDAFVESFRPGKYRDGRMGKFLRQYEGILKNSGRWGELKTAVQERVGVNIEDLLKA